MDVSLNLQLDEFPYESGYSLVCDGTTIWNVPVHTFLEAEKWAFATVTEKTCVSPYACCEFVVEDEFEDGLTATEPGNFHLVYGDETVAQYDGSDHFGTLEYVFGMCPKN